ncbi:integrin alpha-3-like [Hypanus sabinus]|uniref:integrin alpha-3-like n=1 Tax=Hypanus sabinus TaxID=79690 RepID=UPI0028C418AD|nr:integrin alpha-3-like [Hypanus sabinus]
MAPCAARPFQPSVYFLVSAAVSISSAFNVDVTNPIIKKGPDGSYFGYSVALHRQLKKLDRYLLLVGAPQAAGLEDQLANRTGALFYCPVTALQDDCERALFEKPTNPNKESKEDQWLGVTVESQGPGGKVLVCAHRYEMRQLSSQDEKRILVGRCFVISDDIAINPDDDWDTSPVQFCENVGNDHHQLLMCQQGMSAGFTRPNHYAFYGAPGGWNWQGTVQVSQKNITFLELNILEDGPYLLPDVSLSHSYIGYSVTSGKQITHTDNFSYVAGGPRHNHTGAVFVLEQGKTDDLYIKHIIAGHQTGSYFGSSVAVADLDNNSWQDLIVGAPHYFDHRKEISGAVYIYMNEAGKFSDKPTLVLNGSLGSMFGHTVSSIGDINQDGFQDIGIGAPYDDYGKLFIYNGGKNGLAPEPSQIISGENLSGNLSGNLSVETFGYSISGGLDVDSNGYPDLLIGTLSDRAVLLRSRPVININETFSVRPKIIDPNNCKNNPCIKVKVCFSYTVSTGDKNYNHRIDLTYRLEVEKERRSHPRVIFVDTNSITYVRNFSMPDKKCHSVSLRLMDNVQDKLQPIYITLSYNIANKTKPTSGMVDMNDYPILNVLRQYIHTEEIHIQKECGEDRICKSNLQMKYQYGTQMKDGSFSPIERVKGKQILKYNPQSRPRVKLMLQVNVTNESTDLIGEDAHQARLNVTLPDTLSFAGFRMDKMTCEQKESYTLICDLGNPFKKDQRAEILLIFETTGITLHTSEIIMGIKLATESEQNDLHLVEASIRIEIQLPVNLVRSSNNPKTYFSGTVMGESGMKTFDDVGSPVNFTFQVDNQGEPLGDLGVLYLTINWPYEISNGKWLLYLTEIEMSGTEDRYCTPDEYIVNELNLKKNNQTVQPVRTKRDVALPAANELRKLTTLTKGKGELQLECKDKHTARCKQFSCLLRNMTKLATVTFRARLWNSTFLEEFRDYSRISVYLDASLHLKTHITTIKMKKSNAEVIINIESQVDEEPPYVISEWVIVVAVLAGIVLLSIIILLLWKCGFFKRANTRAMYEAKEQKAEIKTQPSETKRLTDND